MVHSPSTVRLTLYAIISSIEIDLRKFILLNLTNENKMIILNEDLINKLKARSKSNYVGDMEDLIDFLDFGDISQLIAKLKNIFPNCYKEQITLLSKDLIAITPTRNRVMHSRPLEFEDFATIKDFTEKLNVFEFVKWSESIKMIKDIEKDPTCVYAFKIPNNINYSDDRIMNNLPHVEFDDTGFIGRKEEQELLLDKIYGSYPVISLIGDGGVGKTALLLKVLYDIIDKENCSYDTILWISLKTRTLNNGEFKNINNSIIDSIGVYQEIDNTLSGVTEELSEEELINSILMYMKEFKVLLALDNLETINSNSIRNFVSRIPKHSKLLITSRIGLGEFEARISLNGLKSKESLFFIKRLAKNYQLIDILGMKEKELSKILKKLYHNPLAIKWFIANIIKGNPIEKILSQKKELIEYCMSNVYDKLSLTSKEIIKVLLIYNRPSGYAEISFLLDHLKAIHVRESLNELISTNMVIMKTKCENDIHKSSFEISGFSREYLLEYSKPNKKDFKEITKKINELKGINQNLNLENKVNPYDPKSLSKPRHQDELLAAINLKNALNSSACKDRKATEEYLTKAKEIAPNYLEVYKISGFLYASFLDDIFKANQEYETALQIRRDYAPILFLYAGFRMRYLDDFDLAMELTTKAEKLDSNNFSIKLQKARLFTLTFEFDEAHNQYNELLKKKHTIPPKSLIILVYYTVDNLKRKIEKLTTTKDNSQAIETLFKAILIIEEHIEFVEDVKINILFSKLLIEFLYIIQSGRNDYTNKCSEFFNIFKRNFETIRKFNDFNKIQEKMYNNIDLFLPKDQEQIIGLFNSLDAKMSEYNDMLSGKIVTLTKGFGFISSNDFDTNVFFHSSDCTTSYRELCQGDIVTFAISEREKRMIAINIIKLN